MKIAIVGAGVSGLTLAHFLQKKGEVTLFEKARGVGGRVSTRRAEPFSFDHGAQFIKAASPIFQDFIQPLIQDGGLEAYSPKMIKIDGRYPHHPTLIEDQQQRYVGVPGNNAFAKLLAKKLAIRLNTRVVSAVYDKRWVLKDEQGSILGEFELLFLAIPSPQALELIPKDFLYYSAIRSVEMDPCFALMLGYPTELPIPFDAAHCYHSDLSWIAVNSRKPGRTKDFTVVLHASPDYTVSHLNDDSLDVTEHMLREAEKLIQQDLSHYTYQALHLWRYASPRPQDSSRVYYDPTLKLGLCGDWCVTGTVEGAFTAAYQLYLTLEEIHAI